MTTTNNETTTPATDSSPLKTWCQAQRAKYKKGQLSEERVKSLEATPGWSWDGGGMAATTTSWKNRYEELQRFVKEKGRLPS